MMLSFICEHFNLVRRPLRPRPLQDYCSALAADMILKTHKWIVKTDEELLSDADSAKPMWPYCDPLLRANREAMLNFFLRISHSSHFIG